MSSKIASAPKNTSCAGPDADLAAGCDSVLVLTLPTRVPPICVESLDGALETLRRSNANVEVAPDESSAAAFASVGSNLLDPSVREKAARAGREQGRTV